ncbi:MAG: PqqD family protein, partial [Desulfobacteraceae bacterium]|nr:PqqD family protein [Desulfobacteraceae bacterium]
KDKNKLMQIKDFEHMENKKYSINHDISCRVEEPEGAVLFNPETDAVKAINPIGLAIWQVLEYPLDKREIIEHLLDICEGVPKESVAQDVDEFIDKLITDGFIGEVVK